MDTQRTLASDAPEAAAWLRHLPVILTPLFAFLTARDVVVLLATSHALRDDRETVRYAMERSTPTRCFVRGCAMDWCAARPTVTYLDGFGCSGDHDEGSGDEEWTDESDAEQQDHVATNKEQAEEDMAAVLASPSRCASLLSLAALMETKLSALLYSEDQAYATIYYVVPFILPLARLRAFTRQRSPPTRQRAIARQGPPPTRRRKVARQRPPPTPLGLHIDNCVKSDGHDDGACRLCEAIAAAIEHVAAYREEREEQEDELIQKLLDDGVLEGSDAFQQAMDEFYESKEETDELYSEDSFAVVHTVGLCEGDQPCDLKLCGSVDYDTALETCDEAFYDPRGFCETKLRPLVAFFTRHGFGRVHRAEVRDYATVDEELPREEIRSVEMVGAAAPHGFFAGVYFIARHT